MSSGKAAPAAHALSRHEFDRRAISLRTRLLDAQQRLQHSDAYVIVLVCGVETSGRNRLVNRFNEWLDPHGVETVGFLGDADGEDQRPYHWRFWRNLPARGRIAVFFDGWYERALRKRSSGRMDKPALRDELRRICDFERMLADDRAIIVKLWCHVSRHEYRRRMRHILELKQRKATAREKRYRKRFGRMLRAADAAMDATDSKSAAWTFIDAADSRYRDVTAAEALLEGIERALEAPRRPAEPRAAERRTVVRVAALERLHTQKPRKVAGSIESISARLNELSWRAHEAGKSTVIVLEGMDAAGKGGAARRIAAALDARLVRTFQVGAPTDEERSHHYLWRFWRQVPPAGYVTLYDRSWYGRVLVERVEGLARASEWSRAYGEINAFEEQLVAGGICVVKFWLDISKDEQLRRFREREKVAYKRYKMTAEDWRNRDRWNGYRAAVGEMLRKTDTPSAPWHLVDGDRKEHARATVLATLCETLERALG